MRLKEEEKKPLNNSFTSDKENSLKIKLIKLLADDGRGHKHVQYAKRLANFDINIVPLTYDPNFTAAMDFDHATILVGEGFINDPSTMYQLNVLMRHELCHYLLMHQIRMMHKIVSKYGDDGYTHIRMSMSLHNLENIIADYEISNKRYTEDDKDIVRHMSLNGKVIGGLVTEDNRPQWKNLSIEQMYEELLKEIDNIHASIKNNTSIDTNDFINRDILSTYGVYLATPDESSIVGTAEEYINNKGFIWSLNDSNRPVKQRINNLPDHVKEILIGIYDGIVNDPQIGWSENDVEALIKQIEQSSPNDHVVLYHPRTGEIAKAFKKIYTPEEKRIAIALLKKLVEDFTAEQRWYEKTINALNNNKYSKADIEKILSALTD